MVKLPIIDFHTHAFPDTLAPRAMAQLTANAADRGFTPHTDGTIAGLLASMDAVSYHGAPIAASVICNIATNARQMAKVNDFAVATASLPGQKRLYPLGSLHPGATPAEIEAELDKLATAGIRGIKIHPDYVGVELISPAFDPILSLCEERGMFITTHAGFDPVSPLHPHATPDMILEILSRYPRLTFIAAHTGGADREDEVLSKLCGTRVYLDTSLAAIRASRSAAVGEACARILRAHDPDRLLFASDSPWSAPTSELEFLDKVGLDESTMEKILSLNAARLLGLQ